MNSEFSNRSNISDPIIEILLNIGNSFDLEENIETLNSVICKHSDIEKCWFYIDLIKTSTLKNNIYTLINKEIELGAPITEIEKNHKKFATWQNNPTPNITQNNSLLSYLFQSFQNNKSYHLLRIGNNCLILTESPPSKNELPDFLLNHPLQNKIEKTLQNCNQRSPIKHGIKSNYDNSFFTIPQSYFTIADNLNEGLIILNNSFSIIYVNAIFANMLGSSKEKLINNHISNYLRSECYDRILQSIKKTEQKNSAPFELRVITKNGERWMLVSTAIIDQSNRKNRQLICTFLDINEKKSAETVLFEKEKLMSQLISSINDFFWIYDIKKGMLIYSGPNFHKIFGQKTPNPEKYPFRFLRSIKQEDLGNVKKIIRGSLHSQEIDFTFRINSTTKTIKQIRIKAFAISDNNNKPVRYAGIASDITQQKNTEEKLFETSLQLINTITAMKDFLFLVDKNQKVISQIPTFQSPSFTNKHLTEVNIPKEASRLILHAFQVLKHSSQSISYDINVKKNNNNLWFNLIITRRNNAEAQFAGIAIHVREITQRILAQEELKIASNIDEIIANTSTRFINISFNKVDYEIELILEQIGLYLFADLGFTYFFNPQTDSYELGHKWENKQKHKENKLPKRIESSEINEIIDEIRTGKNYQNNDHKYSLFRKQITNKSSINIAPIIIENNLRGFLGFTKEHTQYNWNKHHARLLKFLAEIFANAIIRKNSTEKLNTTTNRIKTIIENLNSGVLLENNDQYIEQANHQFCKLFNLNISPEELINNKSNTLNFFQSEQFNSPISYIDRIEELKKSHAAQINEELHLADGKVFERDYTPILYNNNIEGHFWQYRDISDKKRAEQVTKRNEQRLKYALDAANEVLWEWTISDNNIYLSPRWLEITKIDPSNLKTVNDLIALINKNQQQSIKNKLNALATQKTDRIEIEFQINNHNYNMWILLKAKITEYKNNQTYRVVGTLQNITEQKSLQIELIKQKAQAEEATETKSRFIANISHEIRTPMHGVSGLAELLSNTQLSQDQQKFVDAIKASSNNMLTILNDILDISKLSSGKFTIKNTGFEISNIVSTLYYTLQNQAKKGNNNLLLELDDKIAPISIGDPVRINQILLNLLNNALKFTKEGTVLCKITLKNENLKGQKIRFSVIDTGIGIKKDHLNHVFERFNKPSQYSSVKYGGTGLGLAISKQLVDLMDSKLFVKSKPEIGTIFWFSLVLKKGESSDLPKNRKSTNDTIINKNIKILVADDNPTNILIIKTALRNHGNEPYICTNGSEVLSVLKNTEIDLIIMDIQMPILDGCETTKQIRKNLNLATPIIALSGETDKKKIKTYMDAGMNLFLPKPFDINILITSINNLLAEKNSKSPLKATFSLDKIRYLTNNNRTQINQLIETFIDTSSKSIDAIDYAYTNRDWETLYKTAHRIKPTIDTLDITPLNKIIRLLEINAQKQLDTEQTKHYIDDTIRILSEVCSDLSKIKQ